MWSQRQYAADEYAAGARAGVFLPQDKYESSALSVMGFDAPVANWNFDTKFGTGTSQNTHGTKIKVSR